MSWCGGFLPVLQRLLFFGALASGAGVGWLWRWSTTGSMLHIHPCEAETAAQENQKEALCSTAGDQIPGSPTPTPCSTTDTLVVSTSEIAPNRCCARFNGLVEPALVSQFRVSDSQGLWQVQQQHSHQLHKKVGGCTEPKQRSNAAGQPLVYMLYLKVLSFHHGESLGADCSRCGIGSETSG